MRYCFLKIPSQEIKGFWMASGTFDQDRAWTRIKDSGSNGKSIGSTCFQCRFKSIELNRYLQPLKNTGSVIDMPVPSSYNDITTDAQIRDHSGWVWYQQSFFTPASWNLTHLANVWLRVGSAHYYAMVWLNGQLVTSHEGGHLPFEVEVTSWLNPSGSNLLTIAVNNTLAPTTIPQGYWKWKQESASYPAGYFTNDYTFDFFNYAGIHRSVVLYSVPKAIQITDITVSTSLTPDLAQATVWYNVELTSTAGPVQCYVEIKNQEEGFVTGGQGCQGSFSITAPNPWWPNMMSPTPGYLYTLDVSVYNLEQLDRYHLKFGIRELNWDNDSFKINHQVLGRWSIDEDCYSKQILISEFLLSWLWDAWRCQHQR